jgi:hypothetical protein
MRKEKAKHTRQASPILTQIDLTHSWPAPCNRIPIPSLPSSSPQAGFEKTDHLTIWFCLFELNRRALKKRKQDTSSSLVSGSKGETQ